jgi:hypothetical protein
MMRKIKTGTNKIKSGAVKTNVPRNFQKAFIEQAHNKRIENCKNNLDVVQMTGVAYGLHKSFYEFYPKINFHCIGKYQKIITNIINYSDKLFNELKKRNLDLDGNFIAMEFGKLYDIEEQLEAKREDCKVITVKETGIPKETLRFFTYINYTYEIIDKLLVIHPLYRKKEITLAKYVRTYCKKLYEFFVQELESDMEVAI